MNYKFIFKKQIITITLIVLCLSILVIGSSYSLFIGINENAQNQVVNAGNLSITYKNGNTITNNECLNPISDKDAKARKNCTYTVSLENNGTLDANYQIIIYNNEKVSNLVEHKYLRVNVVNNYKNLNELSRTSETLNETNENNIKYILDSGSIRAGDSIDINVMVWLSNDAPYTVSNKNVSLKIEVKNIVSENQLTPMERIMAQLNSYDECPKLVSDTYYIDYDWSEEYKYGLCRAYDNYFYNTREMSYYYIGNENYVLFAGFMWQIVRINGDGTIRIIKDESIGTSAFNDESNDNAYVGYMYGKIGATSYKETHQNINSSTVKKKVDLWYKENILDKGYDDYVSDTIFCNDRQLLKNSNYNSDNNLGYGTNESYYRWSEFPDGTNGNSFTLYCKENDRLTVSDSLNSNAVLTYPVGLITADENLLSYKYYDTWDMTAALFDGETAYASIWQMPVNEEIDVQPVINLKADSLSYGLGTYDNPFIVD